MHLITVCSYVSWADVSDADTTRVILGVTTEGVPDGDGYGIIGRAWAASDSNGGCTFDTNLGGSRYPALHFYPGDANTLVTATDSSVAVARIDSCAAHGLHWSAADGSDINPSRSGGSFLYIANDPMHSIFAVHQAVTSKGPRDAIYRTLDTGLTMYLAGLGSLNNMDYNPVTGFYYGTASDDLSGGLYGSTDGGALFNRTDHTPLYSVAVDTTTGVVYAGGDGVMYASTDAGKTLRPYNNTLPKGHIFSTITNVGGALLCASNAGVFEVLGEEVGVSDARMPRGAAILDIAPNPAAASTTISFSLPSESQTLVRVFDILGRIVAEPVRSAMASGTHTVDLPTSGWTPGIFFVELTSGTVRVGRLLVVGDESR